MKDRLGFSLCEGRTLEPQLLLGVWDGLKAMQGTQSMHTYRTTENLGSVSIHLGLTTE